MVRTHLASRSFLLRTALFSLLLLRSSALHAQGGPVDIQQFKPAMDSKGHFSIDSTQVLSPWNTSFGLLFSYANKPLVLKAEDYSLSDRLMRTAYYPKYMKVENRFIPSRMTYSIMSF